MGISYVDIFVVVFILFGLIFGLLGKFPKKITSLLNTVVAVVVAYFTCGMLVAKVKTINIGGQTVTDFINNTISGAAGGMIPLDAISGIIDGVIKLLVFWLEALVLIIVLSILDKIFFGIIFRKAKKHTAVKSLGLFGAVRGAIIALVVIFPVIALYPLIGGINQVIKNNPAIDMVCEQANKSFVLKTTDKVLNKTKLKCLTYEINGQEMYLYTDLASVKGLLGAANIFLNSNGNPLEAIADMSDDDLRSLFANIDNSPAVKEVITSALDSLDLGIDTSSIDFAAEADAIIEIKNMVEIGEDGEISFNMDNINTDNLANAMAESNLVEVLAENGEGMLSEMDEGKKTEITGKLADKLASGDISQAKYDNLMKLFNKSESDSNSEPSPEPAKA